MTDVFACLKTKHVLKHSCYYIKFVNGCHGSLKHYTSDKSLNDLDICCFVLCVCSSPDVADRHSVLAALRYPLLALSASNCPVLTWLCYS
ncbi:hypothetical protein L1987_46431 [Smallanthus sonchifolius]|uniref:Uncharacterized protein n=1 Tax=Smallanthus sonchifolius TaxID=185202 RepID=A0ACB9G0R2_9ASTR|nr:hypothetical protein L1987_46431 [Smallanthus sonchifolius]